MNPVIIAIAGGTGSGKSYLTEKLVNTYPKNKILRIEQIHIIKIYPIWIITLDVSKILITQRL